MLYLGRLAKVAWILLELRRTHRPSRLGSLDYHYACRSSLTDFLFISRLIDPYSCLDITHHIISTGDRRAHRVALNRLLQGFSSQRVLPSSLPLQAPACLSNTATSAVKLAKLDMSRSERAGVYPVLMDRYVIPSPRLKCHGHLSHWYHTLWCLRVES